MKTFCLFLLTGLLAGISFPFSAGALTVTRSYIETSDGKKVFDDAFVKLLRDKMDTRYESLEVTVFSCFSGGFAEMAADAKNGLQGTWSMTTSRNKKYALNTLGNSRKILLQSGATSIEPLKVGDFYFHGFKPQYIKALLENPKITNKNLYEIAEKNDHKTGYPLYVSSGKSADEKTLHSGTKSNHALIFSPVSGTVSTYLMPKLVEALEGTGYDAEKEIDFAYGSAKGMDIGKEAGKKKVTRNTTLKDLNEALDAINKKLETNPGKEKAYIAINAHGNTEKRIVPKKENNEENQPAQGSFVTPSSGGWTIELDDEFRFSLVEEVSNGSGDLIFDDPYYRRVSSAQFLLTTFQESVSGSVEIFLDGLSAGLLPMFNAGGRDYSLDLNDVFLADLAPHLEDNLLDVTFAFAGEDDFFQLATEWDFDLNHFQFFSHYGMGVSAGACEGAAIVPEPSTLILWIVGVVALGGIVVWSRK